MRFPTDQPGVQPIIDFFGYHPMRPKEEIARKMAELGFRIPVLFDGFNDAMASGSDFVARSEGPDELYHSGLKVSIDTRGKYYSPDHLRDYDARLNDPSRSYQSLIENRENLGARGLESANRWYGYAKKAQEPRGEYAPSPYDDEFARVHSLSYWQVVEGDNLYIVGDIALPDRYYIGRITEGRRSFTVVDGDDLQHHHHTWEKDGETIPDVHKLVEFYNLVRQAELFDSQNVPIIECVDPGNGHEPAFLQYLPTHQKIDSLPEILSGQSEVLLVRGATPPEGIIGFLEKDRFRAYDAYRGTGEMPIGGFYDDGPMGEYLFPRTKVHMQHPIANFSPAQYLAGTGLNTIDHGARSTMYKPGLTLALSKLAMDFLARRQSEQHLPITLHIKADGRQAEVYAQIGDRHASLHNMKDNLRKI